MRVLMLIRAYQVSGHMKARLDPLNLDIRAVPAELDPASYGSSAADMDKEFAVGVETMTGILGIGNKPQTLKSIIARLESAYCDTIGFEYMHIQDRDKCNWLRDRIENQVTD
jgi:2-oxoglutarate dehydrogenase E1 component